MYNLKANNKSYKVKKKKIKAKKLSMRIHRNMRGENKARAR